MMVALLSGCNLTDSDAVKFAKSAVKSDIEYVWKHTSDDAIDETLADSEKRDSLRKFSEKWPESLPSSLRDLKDIIQHGPKIDEIGSKSENDKTVYALTATYQGNEGYPYGEGEIAKVLKFTVEISNKTGLVVDVDFDKVLERNEGATSANRNNEAKRLYAEYKKDRAENKGNIRKILKMFPSKQTSIVELDTELSKVTQLIQSKKYTDLVEIVNSGGYSSEGRKISMGEGFGTKLERYVELKNLTNIPLSVSLEYDLEYSNYNTYKSGENWLGQPIYKTDETRYIEKESVKDSLDLHAQEKDYDNSYFDNIKYYQGYRVTQQRSDGSYSYKWDETKSFAAKNLKITTISIWE